MTRRLIYKSKYNRQLFNEDSCLEFTTYSYPDILAMSGIYGSTITDDSRHTAKGKYPRMTIYFENEKVELVVSINIKTRVVRNSLLIVKAPCDGLGLKIFRAQVVAAMEFGFKYISGLAAKGLHTDGKTKYVGYLVWAKLGFIMTEKSQEKFKEKIIMHYKRLENDLLSLLYSTYLTDIQGIEKTGFELWKDHGHSWEGRFELNSERCKTILVEYIKLKREGLR